MTHDVWPTELEPDIDVDNPANALPPLPGGPLTRASIRKRLRQIAEIDRQHARRGAASR